MTPLSPAPAYPSVMTLRSEEALQTRAQCCAHSGLCTLCLGQPGAAMLTRPAIRGRKLSWLDSRAAPGPRWGRDKGVAVRPLPAPLPEHFPGGCTHHENRNQSHLVPLFVE